MHSYMLHHISTKTAHGDTFNERKYFKNNLKFVPLKTF